MFSNIVRTCLPNLNMLFVCFLRWEGAEQHAIIPVLAAGVTGVGGRRGSMSKSTNYSSSQGSSWNTLKNKILILRGIVVAIKIFSRIVIAKIIIWRCHVDISSSWVNINHRILVKVDSRGDYANMGSSNNDFGNDDPADYFDHDYNALQDQYFVFWRCFTKNLVMKNKLWTSTLIPSCHQPQWNPHQHPELGRTHAVLQPFCFFLADQFL